MICAGDTSHWQIASKFFTVTANSDAILEGRSAPKALSSCIFAIAFSGWVGLCRRLILKPRGMSTKGNTSVRSPKGVGWLR